MSRRAWIIGLVVLVVVLAAGGAYAFVRDRDDCGATVTSLSGARSSSPFLDAEERAQQPDHDRDTSRRHAGGGPTPDRRGRRRRRLPLRAVGAGVLLRPGHRGAHAGQPRLHDARRPHPEAPVERPGGHEAVGVRREREALPGGDDDRQPVTRDRGPRRGQRQAAVVRHAGDRSGARRRSLRHPDPGRRRGCCPHRGHGRAGAPGAARRTERTARLAAHPRRRLR